MQLILDTDIDLSVQTKMSTIQQESLNEKFINTSLMQCNDITEISDGNDECQNQQDVVKESEKKVEAIDQHTSQKTMINEKINDECAELSEICDKKLPENKRNAETAISVQFKTKNEVQEKEEREIIKSGTTVEGKKMEVNNLDKLEESKEYKNDNEIYSKPEQENKHSYNLDKGEVNNKVLHEKIEKKIKDHIEINKMEAQDDVNNSMVENKIEQQVTSMIEERTELTNEIEDNIEKQNQDSIDMGHVTEVHDKIHSSVKADKIMEVVVTHIIEHKNEKPIEENIKMDVTIEEKNTVGSTVTEHEIEEECKVEDEVKKTSEIENKPVKEITENIEMNITFGEQNNVNALVTDDKAEEINEKDREMDIKFDEQDNVNTLVTEDKTEERNEKDSKMDIKCEEQDNVNTPVTDDKTEERNEKDHEMDITFEEQDNVNTIVTDDKTEERNEKNSELDIKCEEQDNINALVTEDKIGEKNEKDSEMNITFEQQDNVNTLVTDEKIEEKNEKDSEMDITFEEKDTVNTLVTDDDTEGKNVKESAMDVIFDEQDKNTLETDDQIKEGNEEISEMDVTFEEQNIGTQVTEDETDKRNKESSEMEVIFEDQDKFNISITGDKIEALHTEKGSVLDEVKDIEMHDKDKADNFNYSTKGNKTDEQSKENSEIKSKLMELYKEENEIQDEAVEQIHKIEQTEKTSEIEDNYEDQQNEISAIIEKLEKDEEEEIQIKDNIKEQDYKSSETKDMEITETSVTNDIVEIRDKVSADECEKNEHEYNKNAPHLDCEKDTVEKQQKDTSNDVCQDFKDLESRELSREVANRIDVSGIVKDDVEFKTKDDENIIMNTEEKVEIQDESITTRVSQMDPEEVIDIADEKDEDFTNNPDISVKEKEPENVEEILTSQEKAESALGNDVLGLKRTFSTDIIFNDKSSPEAPVKETNVDVTNIKKPNTEAKKKLTHISKLSNTLDILSDEEEDLPKEEPNKEVPISADKECTSINIDDDDDIMLIDEESIPNDYKNKTESIPEPENQGVLKVEARVEANNKVEQFSEISENKKDTTQTEVAGPSIIENKTSETTPDLTAQEETPVPKKPFVQPHFLKTCKKNLADMTRDELEEFCILKIVESVVDRSNLSEIKSQLKAMAQNIDEYQKKATILTKQNRDLQVVLKSIQEEQKKKSNMPITPLKITRSVGMQVLMTDKVSVRKKVQNPNTAKNNSAANSGPNRQGKTAQSQIRLQKILTNTSNSPQIPVPRLIPAVNNSSLNNMKIQPITANATGKVASPISSSPIQSVSNSIPAAPPAQKPEKRPLSRMQQNNSVTVDLTDDEPPAKVIARNSTPPVRLVPPQNLLAPHRQPFGQNVSSPRKVYIPISGSQSPVGVRPGQTIMLKTISPQGPRQRAPTPGVSKPNQVPNAVRMQRLGSRHPAPLPDSVKQYQPLNWKALPPAPELKLSKVENGIVISWKIDGYQEENHEEIASYQLYAYQETTSPPSTTLWKKIGDVKALPLPMACTLTQFMAGYKYYFAVRAVDVRSRLGPFSMPGSILLLNKM